MTPQIYHTIFYMVFNLKLKSFNIGFQFIYVCKFFFMLHLTLATTQTMTCTLWYLTCFN